MTETDKMITPEEARPTPADLFHKGMNFTSYDFLGVHGSAAEDGYAYTFRVWAPNAEAVTLNADFTDWKNGLPMIRESEKGLWSVRVESRESLEGRFYKYAVTGKNGVTHLKADPYAFMSETNLKTASIIRTVSAHQWNDGEWLKKRSATVCPKQRGFKPKVNHYYSAPLNVYEVHLGSWKTLGGKNTSDGEHYMNYRDIADKLAPYVSEMGYTHIELMPVM